MTSKTARANAARKAAERAERKTREKQWRKMWGEGARGESAYLALGGTPLDYEHFVWSYASD